MHKGFSLLEMLMVLLIVSLIATIGLPLWNNADQRLILSKEQQRLHLFLRQFQGRVENSNQIWFLVFNRDLSQQRWCAAMQLKNDITCDCFHPEFCPSELSAQFYYPLQQGKTMISAKSYYPNKLISFNGTRNTSDSGCFALQAGEQSKMFSFSNLGRVRIVNVCSSGADE